MQSIAPFSLPGKFYRGNIHTHSTLSDGLLAPAEVIQSYKDAGYDFISLTDHFVSRFEWPIADTRDLRCDKFTTILGAELHAPENSVGEIWHILAVGLPLDFAQAGEREDGVALARRAMEAGAFVGIAHPLWSQLSIEDGLALDFAHGVEVYNHGCAVENDRGDGFYLLDQLLNKNLKMTAFATDDAHFSSHDSDAFGGWVHVKSESLDPDSLLAALKAGSYYGSTGPVIRDVRIDGTMLHVECSPVNAIIAQGGLSRSVVQKGQFMTSATLDISMLVEKKKTGWHPVEPSDWFRLTILDDSRRRAWTNPIW
ncbi:CehA/McbA family metallohydrolase [Alphaproteobacteria bacterium]|jgi:hypothetical protein|nr:CehA/McbA family metallohydrolase [Alphaproteobacteria bacterium]